MSDKYILDGHKPTICEDLFKWAKWFEDANKRVNKTNIGVYMWQYWLFKLFKIKKYEPVRISTVFLGLDHRFGEGEPQLFETMIFGGEFDQEQWRYSTWEEAEKGHQKAIEKVKKNSLSSALRTL